MKCENIKENDTVFFKHDPYNNNDEYEYDGQVIRNFKDKNELVVSYLCGYKSFSDNIPYNKVFGVLNLEHPKVHTNGYYGNIEPVDV